MRFLLGQTELSVIYRCLYKAGVGNEGFHCTIHYQTQKQNKNQSRDNIKLNPSKYSFNTLFS